MVSYEDSPVFRVFLSRSPVAPCREPSALRRPGSGGEGDLSSRVDVLRWVGCGRDVCRCVCWRNLQDSVCRSGLVAPVRGFERVGSPLSCRSGPRHFSQVRDEPLPRRSGPRHSSLRSERVEKGKRPDVCNPLFLASGTEPRSEGKVGYVREGLGRGTGRPWRPDWGVGQWRMVLFPRTGGGRNQDLSSVWMLARSSGPDVEPRAPVGG